MRICKEEQRKQAPTEDRAALMEAAMNGNPIFTDNEKLREKLDYYSRCIRDSFDTAGWLSGNNHLKTIDI